MPRNFKVKYSKRWNDKNDIYYSELSYEEVQTIFNEREIIQQSIFKGKWKNERKCQTLNYKHCLEHYVNCYIDVNIWDNDI